MEGLVELGVDLGALEEQELVRDCSVGTCGD